MYEYVPLTYRAGDATAAKKYIDSNNYVDLLLKKSSLKDHVLSNCVLQVLLHISLRDNIFVKTITHWPSNIIALYAHYSFISNCIEIY